MSSGPQKTSRKGTVPCTRSATHTAADAIAGPLQKTDEHGGSDTPGYPFTDASVTHGRTNISQTPLKIAAHGDLSQFLPIFVPAIATDRDGGSHCGDGHLRRVLLKSLYSKRLHRIGVLY